MVDNDVFAHSARQVKASRAKKTLRRPPRLRRPGSPVVAVVFVVASACSGGGNEPSTNVYTGGPGDTNSTTGGSTSAGSVNTTGTPTTGTPTTGTPTTGTSGSPADTTGTVSTSGGTAAVGATTTTSSITGVNDTTSTTGADGSGGSAGDSSSVTTTDGSGGTGTSAGGGGGSVGTGGATGTCEQGQVAADEVLIIGDSYFPAAGSAIVVELRRLAGANYRDRSVPGAKMDAIINQYDTAPTPQPKVVIMDGGGNDVLQNQGCSPGCDQHMAAVTHAGDFFARVQSEGVQDIVFLFYYDMPAIKAGLDWMRPELRAECEQSPVPCHFVDVQPLFAGQDANEYTTDGIHPTAEAGEIIAGAIWSVMQQDCVAQ